MKRSFPIPVLREYELLLGTLPRSDFLEKDLRKINQPINRMDLLKILDKKTQLDQSILTDLTFHFQFPIEFFGCQLGYIQS